jgi:hypothetical protein
MRTSCIHSLPQEIQIPQPDQDQTKKIWTDFNTKEANNLTNKQNQKKKIISVRQDWVCVFCGKEILWILQATILCEREKKENGGEVRRAD